jgi:hypothetical protein
MTTLMILAALAALLVLACWAGLLPPVRPGTRDWNYRFHVTIRTADDGKYLVQPRAAVLAQELAEWLGKWLGALALAAPVALVLEHFGLGLLTVLVVILAHTWPNWPGGQRQIELVGHMVEAEAAMKLGKSRAYIAEEARRTQPSYPCFKGMTADQVMQGMLRRRWLARLLLAVIWRRARRMAR